MLPRFVDSAFLRLSWFFVLRQERVGEAVRVLEENATLVKMTTAELASVVEGLQGAARTPLGVLQRQSN